MAMKFKMSWCDSVNDWCFWLTLYLCVSNCQWPVYWKKTHVTCVNILFIFWQCIWLFSEFTVLGQWWSGSDCVIYLDKPEDYDKIGKEHSIVIMNHKYDIDWLMAWIISERLGMLGVRIFYCIMSLYYVGPCCRMQEYERLSILGSDQ